MNQLSLTFDRSSSPRETSNYVERLKAVLSQNLNFLDEGGGHLAHKIHSFPAKFPPQLPQKFITELTEKGEVILDPMMGSGTTILEAFLEGRQGIGFDIDPLALLLATVKNQIFDKTQIYVTGLEIIGYAQKELSQHSGRLTCQLEQQFDSKTKEFIDYWFLRETQLELIALLNAIEFLSQDNLTKFFHLLLSSVIITKTGGVSLALDLAHTRPHKAKVVVSKTGEILIQEDVSEIDERKLKILTKKIRSPLEEFEKRFHQSLRGVIEFSSSSLEPQIAYSDSQSLPLIDNSVDLIVTSPPYPSNAIDYMRAHKFSLVWLGYRIDDLTHKKKMYIGSDSTKGISLLPLPSITSKIVEKVSALKTSKGASLHRYYTEMSFVLKEMFRTLKPGKSAILVVGNSTIAGQDTRVQDCLPEIGEKIGFSVPQIGVRQIDRNKRMLPAGKTIDRSSQIQHRMHEEYVIGFYKPVQE